MRTYRISQLAECAGVPATTLRFYEKEGLLPAARSSSGYRQYTDSDLERVQFITASKHLGLPLDQIRDLLTVWDRGVCRSVRDELQMLITAQVAAADDRIDDLRIFRGRLTGTLTHLRELPANDGPCDPACSFPPDLPAGAPAPPLGRRATVAVPTTAEQHERAPIACSLDGSAYGDRIEEWRRLLDGAEVEQLPDGGRAARLPAERAAALAQLIVAEQQCCPFFSFRLTFAGAHIEQVARAPEGAEPLVAALFDQDLSAAGETCSR
ncbi:MerR family transcriptional regulator [Pseudonocardia alaniniphila]|uniref:MerR family transcriptional regulator n=1 Tax=Pseudonocardia alaniniphila TaxID=75291 RepID=A0ABS9THQ6_9PSEU|nr:MerR family transcriptional regulator [Pseudonocardia alaniniphila]MCH6168059.1 MerR family transcriptional regulator [Pseudonocardia alaniniphila]